MKKLTTCSAFVVLLLLAAAPQARAQTDIDLGVRGSYEVDDLEEFALGAGLRIRSAGFPLVINPAFDYYFLDADNASFYQITANALYEFGFRNQVFTPYAGAGLAISRFSFEEDHPIFGDDIGNTEVGLNLVGGAKFELGSLQPFVQAQFVVGGGYEPASITAGLLFDLN